MKWKFPGNQLALARFLPGKENLTFVSLDADDLFDFKKEIQDWYHSGKPFAVFEAHQLHVLVMAELWAARKGELLDIEVLVEKYSGAWYGQK
jgi:hypothetical protein